MFVRNLRGGNSSDVSRRQRPVAGRGLSVARRPSFVVRRPLLRIAKMETPSAPAERKPRKAKPIKGAKGVSSLLLLTVLALACLCGFASRLFAVIRFESIIHEFDPWSVPACYISSRIPIGFDFAYHFKNIYLHFWL